MALVQSMNSQGEALRTARTALEAPVWLGSGVPLFRVQGGGGGEWSDLNFNVGAGF